jgi:hypothetical protein
MTLEPTFISPGVLPLWLDIGWRFGEAGKLLMPIT